VSDDWRSAAACSGAQDPDLWFSVEPERVAAAVAICAACDVQEQCLDAALSLGDPAGTWAGLTVEDRVDRPGHRGGGGSVPGK
jgi:hypothetical protein